MLGWITYYGRFYSSALEFSLNRICDCPVRWLVQKYKPLGRKRAKARSALDSPARLYPTALRPLEARQAITVNDWTMGTE